MKNKKKAVMGCSMVTLICIGIVVGLVGMPNMSPVFTDDKPARQWQSLVTAAPVNPGDEESGVVNVYVYPYQSDTSTYNNALDEGNAYAHFPNPGGLNQTLEHDVPYDTRYDLVITVQFNYAVAYNTTSSEWDADWVRCLITSADLSIGAETPMSKGNWHTINAGEDARINFYYQNVALNSAHGLNINVTAVDVQAFW